MADTVAILGTGLIGRAWAISFARGGFDVALWDQESAAATAAVALISDQLDDLAQHGLLNGATPEEMRARILARDTLASALEGAVHVQENVPEDLQIKRSLLQQVDALAGPDCVIASSSSALLPSAIFQGFAGAERCLVAHPINPPSLIPAVELVPCPETTDEIVQRTAQRMEQAGQAPLIMQAELEGFIVNRLQGALLDEAFRLVAEGYATAEDVDIAVRDGLALRWAFMGPFETIDLNAPAGVADYIARYDAMYAGLNVGGGPRTSWQGEVAQKVVATRRARLPETDLGARAEWRDRQLMALRQHKKQAGLEKE